MKTLTFASENPVTGPVHVGIDQSLTGFAVCAIDADGNWAAQVWKPETRGSERLAQIRSKLLEYLDELDVIDVAMEAAIVVSRNGTVLGELAGVVKEVLFTVFDRPPMAVPPTTLKKYVTGSGNASKSVIMMSLLKRYGVEIPDDNAADAYALSSICAGRSTTKYEAEAVLRVADPKYRV